ncbi:GntR family transcriptional regulator [Cohnella faecalis]|uniref:GntR family transcriptional regulator n=1 Tax=Cohnella faecalis TaxID=2315694 RepID=UPI0039896444
MLPEKELCQVYDISRNSLRQALELLTNEGLLVKMVGGALWLRKISTSASMRATSSTSSALSILLT